MLWLSHISAPRGECVPAKVLGQVVLTRRQKRWRAVALMATVTFMCRPSSTCSWHQHCRSWLRTTTLSTLRCCATSMTMPQFNIHLLQELVADDNAEHAALFLPLAGASCLYKFNRPDYFFQCLLLGLEWHRVQQEFRCGAAAGWVCWDCCCCHSYLAASRSSTASPAGVQARCCAGSTRELWLLAAVESSTSLLLLLRLLPLLACCQCC